MKQVLCKVIRRWLVVIGLLAATTACGASHPGATNSATASTSGQTRTVVDSRGERVEVPADIKHVATISDAFVEEIMYSLGVQAKVNAIGSTCLIHDFSYNFESKAGEKFSYTGGKNPANQLQPYLRDQPIFVRDGQINFESLAAAKPDVLIIHSGCCSVKWKGDETKMHQTLDKLKGLGIPTVVVNGPNYSGKPSIEDMKKGIEVVGDVFGKKDEAAALGSILEEELNGIAARTKDITEEKRAKVLLFGMSPTIRKEGGAGSAFGQKDVHFYLLEKFANAKSVFAKEVGSVPLNAEQVMALDPEVFILPTSNGYHPPRELMDTKEFANLENMRAIRNGRVASLPWSPCNCDQRLEMPLVVMVMAKTAYPEKFADVDLNKWMRSYFKRIYKVDDAKAEGIINALWMDWARK